jgi:hypothetical protein
MFLNSVQSFGSYGVGQAARATFQRPIPAEEYNKGALKFKNNTRAVYANVSSQPRPSSESRIQYAAAPTLKRLPAPEKYNSTYLQRPEGVSAVYSTPYTREYALAQFAKSSQDTSKQGKIEAPKLSRLELLKQLMKTTTDGDKQRQLADLYNFAYRMDIVSKKRTLTQQEQNRLQSVLTEIDKELENFNIEEHPAGRQLLEREREAYAIGAIPAQEAAERATAAAKKAAIAAQQLQELEKSLGEYKKLPPTQKQLRNEELKQRIQDKKEQFKNENPGVQLTQELLDEIGKNTKIELEREYAQKLKEAMKQIYEAEIPVDPEDEGWDIDLELGLPPEEELEEEEKGPPEEEKKPVEPIVPVVKKTLKKRVGPVPTIHVEQFTPINQPKPVDMYEDPQTVIKEQKEQKIQEEPIELEDPEAETRPVGDVAAEIPQSLTKEEQKKQQEEELEAFKDVRIENEVTFLLKSGPQSDDGFIKKINEILNSYDDKLNMERVVKLYNIKRPPNTDPIKYEKIKNDRPELARILLTYLKSGEEKDQDAILNDLIIKFPIQNTEKQQQDRLNDIKRIKQIAAEQRMLIKIGKEGVKLERDRWARLAAGKNIERAFQLNISDVEDIIKQLNETENLNIQWHELKAKQIQGTKQEKFIDVLKRLWDKYPRIQQLAEQGLLTRQRYGLQFKPIQIKRAQTV